MAIFNSYVSLPEGTRDDYSAVALENGAEEKR